MKRRRFTGKKDMIGRKIYEGDYVELHTCVVNERLYKKHPECAGLYRVEYSNQFCKFLLRVIKKAWGDIWFTTKEEARKNDVDPRCPAMSIETNDLGNFNICKVIDYDKKVSKS